jgi:amino acid permease
MRDNLPPEAQDLDMALIGLPLLKCFTISVFAFICHMNVVSVAGELIHPTAPRASKIALRAAATQLVFYIVIGISGYMSFGKTVNQNFITNYPINDMLIVACRLLLTLTIFFALPINTNPTANAFVHLLLTTNIGVPRTPPPREFEDENIQSPLLVEEAEPLKNTRIGMAIYVLIQGMIVAIYAPGVADVISILGGSFGTLIMLVCPAINYCKVFGEELSSRRAKIMISLLSFASLVSLTAVICTVMKLI